MNEADGVTPTTVPSAQQSVPDVIGESEVEASAELAEAGFIPVVVESSSCGAGEASLVNFQRPEEDATAEPGSVVQLLLGCVSGA